MPSIYCITNKINQKQYIGQTVTSIGERFSKHKYDAFVQESNYAIHVAMRKYGIEAFSIIEIESCKLEELNNREQYWIQKYNTYENGYNETYGGEGCPKYDYYKIYTLFQSGLNQTEIANLMHCERHTIKRALNSFDVEDTDTLKHKYYNARKRVACIDLQTQAVLKLFNSLTEAALYEGVTVSYISLICNKQRHLNKNYTYIKI